MANVDENEIVSEASLSDNPKDAEASFCDWRKGCGQCRLNSTQPPKTKAGMIQGLS